MLESDPPDLTMSPFAPKEVLFIVPDSVSFDPDEEEKMVAALKEVAAIAEGELDTSAQGDVSFGLPGGNGFLPQRVLRAIKLCPKDYHEGYEQLVKLDEGLRARAPQVILQPNWLVGAATNGGGGNGAGAGPGARPLPMPRVQPLRLRNGWLDQFRRAAMGGGPVRLIFLDAWNGDPVETGRHLAGKPLYRFLNDYARDSQVGVRTTVKASRTDDPDPFPMPDHGLFAASLAGEVIGQDRLRLHDSIASRLSGGEVQALGAASSGAPITMEAMRVLNEWGGGDSARLIEALGEIAASVQDGERVIVNMSLVLNIPDDPANVPDTYDHIPKGVLEHFDGRWPWQAHRSHRADRLDRGLYDAFRALYDRGVLLIAAAGNNSSGASERAGARFPAAYDEVVDVTAAQHDGTKEAWYANRATAQGVAVFGGEVILQRVEGRTRPHVDPTFPLVGPFTDNNVPMLGEGADPVNTSGMVAWAGTSFAAPLASGLAALLWAADPSQSAGQVTSALRACSSRTLPAGTPFIDLFDFV